MKQPNMVLRFYAKEHKIPLWAVASEMKISLGTLHNRLNAAADEAFYKEFIAAVDTLSKAG